MDPQGGKPHTYSKAEHYPLFTKVLVFWEPSQEERASCCTNKKGTRSNPLAFYTHCKTRTHLEHLSKEKIETLKKKLDFLLVHWEAFDPLKAPLFINHYHPEVKKVALGTLKGSYK